MALAVVTVGFNLGLLDVRVLNSTVLVILVTCAIAPMITSRAAARVKIAMLQEEDNDAGPQRHNRTLIPVANPLTAPSLVEMAVLMRNDRGTHDYFALHVRAENTPRLGACRATPSTRPAKPAPPPTCAWNHSNATTLTPSQAWST